MNHIRKIKKQARLRAAASGISHQAELNAIAREQGHDSWGSLRHSLETACVSETAQDEGHDLEDLIDAFRSARHTGGHLVVLRASHEEEDLAIAQLRKHGESHPQDAWLAGASFGRQIDPADFAIATAASPARTIVAGSRGFHRDTPRGNFVVRGSGERLSQINALYSRRDQQTIHATMAVTYALPRTDDETGSVLRPMIGKTTIRKASSARNTDARDRNDVCWVCLAPFGRAATADEIEGSPLGGPFSSPKCADCRTYNATTQGQAAHRIMHYGVDEALARAERGRRPDKGDVHVFAAGAYVPLRTWAATPAVPEYVRRWKEWEADTSKECPAQ